MRRSRATRLAFALAASLVITGCVRHTLLQEFDRPGDRLRAALHPATVSLQEARDARSLKMTIGIFAPFDSSVVIVLRNDVPATALAELLNVHAVPSTMRGGVRYAIPVISYHRVADDVDITQKVRVDSLTWPHPQNWLVRDISDRAFGEVIPESTPFLIVRPGEDVRIYTTVDLTTHGFDPNGKYRVHLDWHDVPTKPHTRLYCGAEPLLTNGSPPQITCGAPDGIPANRTLDGTTRMISVRYAAIAVVAALVGGAVAVISR